MSAAKGLSIPLSRPDIQAQDRAAVDRALGQDWLSRGPMQGQFETALGSALGLPHAVAVSSGTDALSLILQALEIGPGDQVLTTPFTVPATLNAIHRVGAVPVLIDIEPNSLAIDPQGVSGAMTPRTRAIMVVHPFGIPAAISDLVKIANDHQVALIEDSCEALGTRVAGRALGGFGIAGAFGFYPNKQITTGEGGAVVCSDPELALRVRQLANHGRRDGHTGSKAGEETGVNLGRSAGDDWLDQELIGFNARLSDIACALGLSQLQRLPQIIQQRQALMAGYANQLAELPGLDLVTDSGNDTQISWFACPALLPPGSERETRDQLVEDMAKLGVQCGRYFAPMHRQPAWKKHFENLSLPVCEDISARMVILPLFNQLQEREQDYVAACLKQVLG